MKHIIKVVILVFIMTGLSMASSSMENPSAGKKSLNSEGQIVLQTIQKLEEFGYITNKSATEAKKEFVFDNESLYHLKNNLKKSDGTNAVNGSEITFKEYLTFINMIKLLAVLAFLIAFRGVILKFVNLFRRVPVWVYQALVLSVTIYMTFFPENIWESELFYIRNFGVIANLLVLVWIYEEYKDFFDRVLKYISLNVPPKIVISVYVTLYFGYFAIMAESQFLGIFALVGFVSIFGFFLVGDGLETSSGYDEGEVYMNVSMLVNGLLIVAYSYVVINNIPVPYLDVFSVGIEYISTLAFIIALIINGSWWYSDRPMFVLSILLMVGFFLGSVATGILYNLEVIPAIINTGFVIFLLGWLGYLSSKLGGIIMSFMVGLYLYGFALLVESNPELFVTALF